MESQADLRVIKKKVVFLGDQSVGKTAIIERYNTDQFNPNNKPTIGIDFITKTHKLDDQTIKLQLWDTAGQERFKSLIPGYLRESDIVLLIFDVTKMDSFNNLESWFQIVQESKKKDVVFYVVGNKIDLDNRQVSEQQGRIYAKQINSTYQEVSAKENTNIQELFRQVVGTTIEKMESTFLTSQPNIQNKKSVQENSDKKDFKKKNLSIQVEEETPKIKLDQEIKKKQKCCK